MSATADLPQTESHDMVGQFSPSCQGGALHAPPEIRKGTLLNDQMSVNVPVAAATSDAAVNLSRLLDIDDIDMAAPLYPTPPSSPSLTFTSIASLRLKSCQSASTTSAWDRDVTSSPPSSPPSYRSKPRQCERMALTKWQHGLLSPQRRRDTTDRCCGEGVGRGRAEREVRVKAPRPRSGWWCCGSLDDLQLDNRCDARKVQDLGCLCDGNDDELDFVMNKIDVGVEREGEVDVVDVEVEGAESGLSQIGTNTPRHALSDESDPIGTGSNPYPTSVRLLPCIPGFKTINMGIRGAEMVVLKHNRVLSWLEGIDVAASNQHKPLSTLDSAYTTRKRKPFSTMAASVSDVNARDQPQPRREASIKRVRYA